MLHTATLAKALEKQKKRKTICAMAFRAAVCEEFAHSVHLHLLIVTVHVWCHLKVKFCTHKLHLGAIIALCFIFFKYCNHIEYGICNISFF